MAEVFKKFRPGYEIVKSNFEWNVRVPFLLSTDGNGVQINSSLFSPKETPNNQWILSLYDQKTKMSLRIWHYNSLRQNVNIADPVLIKISILYKKKKKVLKQMASSNLNVLSFKLIKEMVIKSDCQQENGSYTFSCKILSHKKKELSVSSTDPPGIEMNCSNGLITHMEKLFDTMQLSDVVFKIGVREFSVHKNILAARSEVFADMFQRPKKKTLTNRITIQDVEPEVFQELLRFIYTGQLCIEKMESLAAGLFIAADKYMLDDLKVKCENYFLHHMSPDNSVILLLHGNLLNPADHLNEAAKFFRSYPSQVMATDGWKKMKKEKPVSLLNILEFVYRYK
jgi:speckle-type POZ protein